MCDNWGAALVLHDSEDAAFAALLADDPSNSSAQQQAKYLYRGQLNRRARYLHNQAGTPASDPVDSLIPTDYRGAEESIVAGTHLAGFTNEVAYLRSVFTHFCVMQRRAALLPNTALIDSWIDMCENRTAGQRMDPLGSIGQHYGLATGYLDVTASIRVALWFATHRFNTGGHEPSGRGWIYRFELQSLEEAEDEVNVTENRSGRDACRHVQIADTPSDLAPRAAAQHGWSLIRFENPRVIRGLLDRGGLTVFGFRRATQLGCANSLTKGQLVPNPDPLFDFIEQCRHNTLTNWTQDFQAYLDAHLNAQLPPSSRIDIIQDPALVGTMFA